jgi:hypothetical protein
MSCCKTYLGSFPHNEPINTGITVTVSGTYTYLFEFAGTKFEKTQNVVYDGISPSPLIIPKGLNENYLYNLIIYDPNGNPILTDGCENYTLKTFILTTNECDVECEPFEYN